MCEPKTAPKKKHSSERQIRITKNTNNIELRGGASIPFVEVFTGEELSDALRSELAESLMATMMNLEIGHPIDQARAIGWIWFQTLPGTSWVVGGRFDDTLHQG